VNRRRELEPDEQIYDADVIIFGIRSSSSVRGRVTQTCQKCGVRCAQTIVKITRRFALFFIPLFPVGSSHVMICTSCTARFRLSAEQVASFETAIATPASAVADVSSPGDPEDQIGG
jgi:hypothetical protein